MQSVSSVEEYNFAAPLESPGSKGFNAAAAFDTTMREGGSMANEMPSAATYTGLSRKVLQYSENFLRVINRIKKPDFRASEWTALEDLVDIANFQRVGVFLANTQETSNWQQYKKLLTEYGGATSWEGTLRRITEVPGLVFLELEERNTRDGVTDISNTVTIYEFNQDSRLRKLHVYVSHVGRR